jgi:hypothetical protein
VVRNRGLLLQRLADETYPGVGNRRPQRLSAAETFCFDCLADGAGVNAEFAGYGANPPVLCIEVAPNLRTHFGTDHDDEAHLRLGMRGNGWTKRPLRPQIRQRSRNPGWISGRRGSKTAPAPCAGPVRSVPQPNDAGQLIEREP